jgi:hypothetical protein
LELTEQFDVVLVTSLFTHLPARRFAAWLARLCELVTPSGCLLFSTLDPVLKQDAGAADRASLERDGMIFVPVSEEALPGHEYGTTWASPELVCRILRRLRPTHEVTRLRRAICNVQDLWVVRPSSVGAPAVESFQGEPEVWIEHLDVRAEELEIRGWLLRRWGRRVRQVSVEIDGRELGRMPVDVDRPDVASALGVSSSRLGWAGLLPLRSDASELLQAWLGLRGFDEDGVSIELWGGSLYAALLEVQEKRLTWTQRMLRATQAELEEARRELAAGRRELENPEKRRFSRARAALGRLVPWRRAGQ